MIDLGKEQDAYATYCPAIQDCYTDIATQIGFSSARSPRGIMPEHLDFLRPNPLYGMRYVLSSAGLPGNRKGLDSMITQRDRTRGTVVIGDSGGFQAISGQLGTIDAVLCRDVLRWQERYCDVGITLDVPLLAVDNPSKSGFSTYQECRDRTVQNIRYIEANRSLSSLRLLNVLQGRNGKEADDWYEHIRPYKFDGWAWGGILKADIYEVCRRIIILRENGDLTGKSAWLHFLGVQRPSMAVVLTAIRRALRSTGLPEMEVTFDSATPIRSAWDKRFGTIGLNYCGKFSIENFTFEHTSNLDPTVRFPFRSPLGELVTMGDLMRGPANDGEMTWDNAGRAMLAHHNVFATIMALADANRLIDHREKLAGFVPQGVRKVVDAVHAVLESDQPMAMLKKHRATLRSLVSGTAEDEVR